MAPKKAGKRVAEGEVWAAVRLSERSKAELERWAQEEDRSQSYILRRVLEQALAARAAAKERDMPATGDHRSG